MLKVIMSCVLVGLFSTVSYAATDAQSSKVASAKRNIIEDSDQAFLDTLTESDGQAAMTSIQARSFARWVSVGAYLGACSEFVQPSLKADWLVKLDNLHVTTAAGGDAGFRSGLRERGLAQFEAGDGGSLAELTDTERRQLCAINIEAARQVLDQIQF